jgi:replication-associated recombination protein RarA
VIIGHEAVLAELERDLPPVTLLIGPESVGKATIARYLAACHAPPSGCAYYEKLSAATAREIVENAPVLRAGLTVRVISLDTSTEAAQNILLKVLEEPPAHCRFILVASRVPLLTILSRSRTYRMGMLSSEQVAEVLMLNGVSKAEAGKAAARGRGQVAPAMLSVDREASRITSVVAAAVRAASEGITVTVDMALRNWTPEHTRVLERWATEKANGRWVYFTPEFAPAATRHGALNILYVLTQYDARTAPAVALDALKEPR